MLCLWISLYKGHFKKQTNIRFNKIFIHLLVWLRPLNWTVALPGGTVLVRSWPRPATLSLTWTDTSVLREMMMRGGAFGAGSNVGSSLKYKTASNASGPGYLQGVLKKTKSCSVENIKREKYNFIKNSVFTWWWVVECGIWRCCASFWCVGHQQVAETHHDWIVMIMVCKDHPNPRAVA